MEEGNTFANALIGAAIGTVSSGVLGPLAPVVGGGVAGYLEGGDRRDGLRVGAYAGAMMLALSILIIGVIGTVLVVLVGGFVGIQEALAASGIGIAVVVLAVLIGLVTTVGFAAIGGYLGNYVKTDVDN